MTRIASFLIFVALMLHLQVVIEPDGTNAIAFSFLGAPMLGLGIVAAIIGIRQSAGK